MKTSQPFDETLALKYTKRIVNDIEQIRELYPDDFHVILLMLVDLSSACLVASCDTKEAFIYISDQLLFIYRDCLTKYGRNNNE